MNIDWMGDLQRDLHGAAELSDERVGLAVGSVDRFVAAKEKIVSLKTAPKDAESETFCGVTVVENPALPESVAVLLQGGKIVNIIKFAIDG